jgi:spore maturation protein B
MADLVIPCILAGTACVALWRRENVYAAMTDGAAQGLRLLATILPALVVLLTAVHMLRASGALDLLAQLLGPLFQRVGLPPEVLPLMLVRPFSGSGALAVGVDLMSQYGVDSLVGRTAAVMLGSTETTFYTLTVYFGASGIRRSRYTLPAALLADLTGFLAAAVFARLL